MAEPGPDLIDVVVVYALPRTQTVVSLKVPRGTTAGDAIALSGIAAERAGVGGDVLTVGIFGKRVALSTVLREHDRVEIYRPLIADPKQARRRRAESRKTHQP